MAAASRRCLLTHFSVLLLGVWLHADVEASSCERDIHTEVGETVELSSCLPAEGVDQAIWRYGETDIARMIGPSAVYFDSQFKGRVNLNLIDFSLTVRELTLQDSGDFRFVSEVNSKQRETIFITLHVHEIITKEPTVTSNSTWHASNESCTLHLECSVTSTSTSSTVTYSWTVKNQTWSGSSLNYVMTPQDGDTKFTCTVSNVFSETTTVITRRCSNITDSTPPIDDYYDYVCLQREEVSNSSSPVLLVTALVTGLVFGLVFGSLLTALLLHFCKSRGPCCNRVTQSEPVNRDEVQQPVYSSLLHSDANVYETVSGSAGAGTAACMDPGP